MSTNDGAPPAAVQRTCVECGADLGGRAIGDYCPKCGKIWGLNIKGADADGSVGKDTPCRTCGYNLRGLNSDGVCPECGQAAGVSLGGELLRYSDPDWLDAVASGARIVFWAAVVAMIVGVTGGLIGGTILAQTGGNKKTLAVIVMLLTLPLNVVFFWGMWRLTTPDPGGLGERAYGLARKLVRVAAVANLASMPLHVFNNVATVRTVGLAAAVVLIVLLLCAALLKLTGAIAQFYYMEKLAERAPDGGLASLCRTVRKGLIACAVAFVLGAVVSIAGKQVLLTACIVVVIAIAAIVLVIMAFVALYRIGTLTGQQAAVARRVRALAVEARFAQRC